MGAPLLAHTIVAPEGAAPERLLVVLHGILGSGANWRGIARRLVAARPGWGAVLVDLRLHGASQGFPPPHDLDAVAGDLATLARALPAPARAVLGHSFGGKVALAWLAAGAPLDDALVVDSTPSARPDARGSEQTVAIVRMLRGLAGPFATRRAFVEAVEHAGHPRAIAEWLAMNLAPGPSGFELRLDPDGVEAMLAGYFARDLWPVVERPPAGARVHLVAGERSPVLDAADRARAEAAAAALPSRVDFTMIPGAGHWVHVDAPDALLAWALARLG